MHLKSVTLKGFKSFPDRTRLDFGPGVSVVVGPNGSGKSNVTDAVLWAMGEQSPLAVRGQSMQDVIFGGGRGVQARSAAEVEIVLDNADAAIDLPVGEISVLRRLDRSGEGEYRLNGARCRLIDVIEVLSDTGLGREMHSIISQGRVESIITSKPRDRRLLIEEAAGLGKHRKRRRRAQLKLERTQENVDRALDVEREARSRLRPLKRQAEAAELHARLERQTLEVRWELARDALRARTADLAAAEREAQAARGAREDSEAALQEVIARRERAELALAQRSERRDEIARRVYGARSAHERLGLRLEQVRATAERVGLRAGRAESELAQIEAAAPAHTELETDRVAQLESELAQLARSREQQLELEVADLERARAQSAQSVAELEQESTLARATRDEADARADHARAQLREAEREAEGARAEAARAGAELAAVNQFLRSRGGALGGTQTLSDQLQVRGGYELALAAALDGRLGAGLAGDLEQALELLNRSGPDGGSALVTGAQPFDGSPESPAERGQPPDPDDTSPPVAGALRLSDLIGGAQPALGVARRLLRDAWVVERLEDVPDHFGGIAATIEGRVWLPWPSDGRRRWGEVRQVAGGGADRVLAKRNQRERLIAATEAAAQREERARQAVERASLQVDEADLARDRADRVMRETDRERSEAAEALRRSAWLIEQRRRAPEEGPLAVRRAELEGELASERRQRQRAERERDQLARRVARLRAQRASDLRLVPASERLAGALSAALEVVSARLQALEAELAADRSASEDVAATLRACAGVEAEIQTRLRTQGEAVTTAEVAAQRLRDQAGETAQELAGVAERLGLEATAAEQALDEAAALALRTRLERLERRREQLGPVNPLAQDEYAEAVAHVEELEARRTDLETALRELRGVIRDTDRQIQETFQATFAAAADNFEQLIEDVFPGGRGRLRLVREDAGPRPVLGGQSVASPGEDDPGAAEAAADAAAETELEQQNGEDLPGVEIEVTPAGKTTKRLSLLSGGEKSMTALAFLFAVFLAKPCPFYILDEVEAALDDLNLDRFLRLLRRYSGRAQFIVITHQKRTMEAADWLYGVSMGGDGVSKVISRRLPPDASSASESGSDHGLAAAAGGAA